MSSRSAATIAPARRLRGRVRVPGDKSISHRYAILAALAAGPSELANYSTGADCASTLACLKALGVEIGTSAAGAVTVMGRGLGGLRSASGPLDTGNSGTTIRLMAGVLAGHAFPSTMVGDESLSRRPMRRVIEPLSLMGARIDATNDFPPLHVYGTRGTPLRAIAYSTPVPSAQIKSAVLLAGLHAEGTTSVTEPAATRDHTERALVTFGGRVSVDGLRVKIEPGQHLSGQALVVPGDISSAAFWLVAAAAFPGSRVEVEDVGLNPTRTALLDVLRRFGADVAVTVTSADKDGREPRGTIVVAHASTSRIEIAPAEVPLLIDELPALAALAVHGGEVSVSGARELRVKESDRIAALVAGFRALGIDADERPDGFVVAGSSTPPRGGVADAQGDHRMAMTFAIAALAAEGPSTITGADSVAISYPGFFDTLNQLVAPSATDAR